MRRHVVTPVLATAGLAAALPMAQVSAATPADRPAASAPGTADGGVHARATATDAQQRAFWTEREKNGSLRRFAGKLTGWKPEAEPSTSPAARPLGDAASAVWREAALAVFRFVQGTDGGRPGHVKVTTLTNANNNLADLYAPPTAPPGPTR